MPVPQTLKDALVQQRCVPFVGSGVSMAVRLTATGGPAFPSWRQLLVRCAERLDGENKTTEAQLIRAALALGTPDYLYAARKAREYLGPVWFKLLTQQIDPAPNLIDLTSLDLARAVWSLGSKLVVTSNYDRVLQWAAPDQNELQTWDIESRAAMTTAIESLERPTVWYLHGHIQDPTELVLTPDGYEILYGSVDTESRYRAAIQTLRHALATKTLLFIGFSGDDPYFAAQIRRVDQIFGGAAGPHYILIKRGTRVPDIPAFEPVFFEDFGAPLLELIGELSLCSPTTKFQSEVDKDSPAHFLSAPLLSELTASIPTRANERRSVSDISDVNSFSDDLVSEFRRQLRLDAQELYPAALTNEEFLDRTGYRRGSALTIGGVLLFTPSPFTASVDLTSAVVQCVVYGGESKSSERIRARFSGPLLKQIVEARDFIAKNIRRVELPAEHSMQSVTEYEYPMICVREMIANALCHRDYSDAERMTHLRIFADRIEIASPGEWYGAKPPGAGPHPIDKFKSQSIQRNMPLAHGVSMVSIVEMEGSGIPTSVHNCESRDAPIPTVLESDGFVQVTIYPRRTWDAKVAQGRVYSRVSPDIEALQQMLTSAISRSDEKGQTDALVNLAQTYLGIKSFAEAQEFAQRAITLATAVGDQASLKAATFLKIKADMMLRMKPS
ncbi:SIR2 family protein [Ideonella sp. BN130291]|uniref:SIR2 family protein n=1 Tax=Ideonella sp. BN130291 TaxID=3112940 RepID=UPI002E26DA42|nr:SIR2 family protein [Ideonella sp. BN130291]